MVFAACVYDTNLYAGGFQRRSEVPVPAVSALRHGRTAAADALVGAAFFTDALSWLFVVLSALATVALLKNRLKLSDPAFRDDRTAGLRMAVVIGLSLTFYPVVRPFALGQIQPGSTACSRWRCCAG